MTMRPGPKAWPLLGKKTAPSVESPGDNSDVTNAIADAAAAALSPLLPKATFLNVEVRQAGPDHQPS